MGIQGTGLHDQNVRFRFFAIVFVGILAFGAVLYWRSATLSSAEYVQIGTETKNHKQAAGFLHSKNYQLEIEDTSPAVK